MSDGRRRAGPGRAAAGSGRPAVAFLYEDDDLVAVDKPCGLPTIAPEGSRSKSLYDVVTARIRQRNPKGRAAVVHRLDRDTSGVIVFAKNARAKAALMSSWNESVDERRYVALVEGEPPSEDGVLDSWLSDADPYRVRQVPPGTRGALRAVTRYRTLASGDGLSLVELSLETGRRHQIRAQLSAIGCPVAGDERYGSRRDPIGRLALHATLIVLDRPSDGSPIRIDCPEPPSFAAALRGSPSGSPTGRRSGPAPKRRPAETDQRADGDSGERPAPPRGRRPPRPGAPDGRTEESPSDRTRAWPGGGPSSRSGRRGPGRPDSGPGKSSSRYSTRSRRKP